MKSQTPATEQDPDVLILVTGMAGLIAAAELQSAGQRVRVLHKGRGGGGRLASQRIGAATLDHGAQFIAARNRASLEQGRRAGALADGVAAWMVTPAGGS